jgi:hypothetical protein
MSDVKSTKRDGNVSLVSVTVFVTFGTRKTSYMYGLKMSVKNNNSEN